ncbi:hypothetical protein Tco_1527163 [Tanacetum coccineum]
MAVRVPPAMSSGLSASLAEVAAMSESVFRKRFRSFCESSPFVSPPDLPSRKRYRGTSELVEDSEEDEEIEESLDSDSGLTAGVEGPGMDDESYDLDDESHEEEVEAVPRAQQQAALVVETAVSAPLGLRYGALRRLKLALEEDNVYSAFEVGQGSGSTLESERPKRVSEFRQPTLTTWTDLEDGMVYIGVPTYPPPSLPVQTIPLPEWRFGSLPISPSPSVVPSPISSPMIPLNVPSPIATPATAETEGFLTELGAQVEMDLGELVIKSVAVRDEIFSQGYWFRSLEYEQESVTVTFGVIWRPGENQDLQLQLIEERRARLELDEVVDGMRRGKESRGGA